MSLRDFIDHSLQGSGDRVPKHIAAGVLTLIDRLSPGDGCATAIFTPAT